MCRQTPFRQLSAAQRWASYLATLGAAERKLRVIREVDGGPPPPPASPATPPPTPPPPDEVRFGEA